MGQRQLDVRDVASLGQAVPGNAPSQLGAVHHLVRQAVELAPPERALEDGTAFVASIYAPRDVEEPLTREPFELAPKLVGAPQECHVGWMFPVGEPPLEYVSARRLDAGPAGSLL